MGVASGRAGAQPSAPGRIVELPPFVVKDTRLLPPPESWRYAKVPGFEVLSSASDGATEKMVHDFLLFHRAVEAIWPTVRMNASVSASIVLCRNTKKFSEFIPVNLLANASRTLSLTLQDKEEAAIVVNLENPEPEAESGGGGDNSAEMLHDEYVHFIVSRIGPRTPPWLAAALVRMFDAMGYLKSDVVIPKVSDPELAARQAFASAMGGKIGGPASADALASDKNFGEAVRAGAFMPFDRLFSIESAPTGSEGFDDPWTRESYEFLHLCLFGAGEKFRQPFLKFAYLAAREPMSEGLFRGCFGLGYRDMLAILWGYTGFSKGEGFELDGPGGKPLGEVAPLDIRKATDAESARIKGEAQRMAGRVEDARYSLIAPYNRGSRDPQLLAALGLAERAAGRDERALRFLEAACAGKTDRARAYLALARLRLKADLAHPDGGGERLGVDQLVGVLSPLFGARKLRPPLPEVYQAIAESWSHASIRPQAGHVAAVDEGVGLFPYDSDLVYADARLHAEIGDDSGAAALCDLGASFAADAAVRARFAALRSALPAARR